MNKPAFNLLRLGLSGLLLLPCLTWAEGVPPPTEVCLKIIKEVSPNGVEPWFDANTEAEAVSINDNSKYRITAENCGDDKLLNLYINDPLLGVDSYLNYLKPGTQWVAEYSAAGVCDNHYGAVKNTVTVSGTAQSTGAQLEASDVAWVQCAATPTLQGCTPGYWKQTQHFDSWPASYRPTDQFSAVFGTVITVRQGGSGIIVDPNLLQALNANGGQINALARHAVAALLNAASNGVAFNLSTGEVIDLFNTGYLDDMNASKNLLAQYNEQGCPLN